MKPKDLQYATLAAGHPLHRPEENDLEALDLAGCLGMTLEVSGVAARVQCGGFVLVETQRDDRDTDLLSHLRRAICLAAVAVGKRMVDETNYA